MTGLTHAIRAERTVPSGARPGDAEMLGRVGRALLLTTVIAVTLVALPVIVRGAPLADDYAACVDVARRGLVDHITWMFGFTGMVRPARYLEVVLIGSLCGRVHLGLVIAVPFALTRSIDRKNMMPAVNRTTRSRGISMPGALARTSAASTGMPVPSGNRRVPAGRPAPV